MVLNTDSENAGTQATCDGMTPRGNATLDNINSVDKVVDKDPKNQHEDTDKSQEDKPKETVVSLNSCLASDSKKVSKLVAEKGEVLLQPRRYNDVEAHDMIQELALAFSMLEADHTKLTTENDSLQEKGQALDIENISLLEEKHEISREIEKLERSLDTRQQLLDESMRLLVR
jgi:predicted DNA binding protein